MRLHLPILSIVSATFLCGCGGSSSSGGTSAPVIASTTVTLTATPNPAPAGAAVTLTATATSSGGVPSGTVSFLDGQSTVGSSALNASGVATFSTSGLAAGATHSLTAALPASTGFGASTSTAVSLTVNQPFSTNASFSFGTPHQTIAGFGGAEAFYQGYLDSHPNESQIMSALYDPVKGLGITFLRLQNTYYNYDGTNASTFDTDNAKIVSAATTALGSEPSILMSAWTPPASLKSNNSINGCTGTTNGACSSGFGTLAQVNGAYNYAGYGQF